MNPAEQTNLKYIDDSSPEIREIVFTREEREALERFNGKVGAQLAFEDVMNLLFEETGSLFACDRMGIAFVEDDGRRIVSRWNRTSYEPKLLSEGYSEDMHGSSLNTVLKSGRVRVIRDLSIYAREHPESRSTSLILQEGVRSSMTCPLVVDGRIVGVLFRSSKEPDVYDNRQIAMHLAVVERLGQAVEKCYMLDQVRAANKAYFEMLGFVTHELKNPVASIVMDARTLIQGYLGELTLAQKNKLEKIVSKGDYLLGLVRDYLDLARLEGGDLSPEFRRVGDFIEAVVEPAVEIVAPAVEARRMRLTRCFSEGKIDVECDPGLMKIAMVNLLGNAAKYGFENGEIRVKIEGHSNLLVVSVWNTGPGFPESRKSMLFKKFSRIKSAGIAEQNGTGVGLYTTWRIVRMHGGRISARTREGEWAEFIFAIPQPLEI